MSSALFVQFTAEAPAGTVAGIASALLVVGMLITRQILDTPRSRGRPVAVRAIDVALLPLLVSFVASVSTFAWDAVT